MNGVSPGLAQLRPACVPGLRISRPTLRGTTLIYIVRDPGSGRLLEVRAKEQFIISRLDGSRTLAEIGEQYAAHFGTALGQAQWEQMLGLLYRRGLLSYDAPDAATTAAAGAQRAATSAAPAAATATATATPTASGPQSAPGSGSMFSGSVRLVSDAPALIERLHHATAFARRRAVLVPLLAVLAAMLADLALHAREVAGEGSTLIAKPQLLFPVLALLWLTQGLHELGHGVVGRACGGKVTEIGLRWHWGAVLMYCKVEGAEFFAHRRGQVAMALAGFLANLLALLPFAVAWAATPGGGPARQLLGGLLAIGVVWALVNLLPLPPLDGYRVLCYALGVSRLATESRRFARLTGARVIGRGPGAAGYTARMRTVYGGYAVALVALPAAFCAALVWISRRMLMDHFGRSAGAVPPALVGGALALWLLGLAAARLRSSPKTAG